MNRVLLATNFRPSSAAATQLANAIANQVGAELHAVHVIGDYFEQISIMFPESGLGALTRLRGHVEEQMAELGGRRPNPTTHIVEGRPYQEIVKLADNIEADVIVVGTAVHGSLFGSSQVLGSEIERVIRNAPCPVFCVPAAKVVTPLPALVTQIVPRTLGAVWLRSMGLFSFCHTLKPPSSAAAFSIPFVLRATTAPADVCSACQEQ